MADDAERQFPERKTTAITVDMRLDKLQSDDEFSIAPTQFPDSHSAFPAQLVSSLDPQPGQYLDKYVVQAEIARGGMGILYRCKDKRLKRDIAVKVLCPQHQHNIHLKRRFLHEARLMASLHHPGIIPVFETGVLSDHRPYIAMELVYGRTMEDHIRNGQLATEPIRLIKAFGQVCQTVAYAHSKGIMHLDLKPSNIMLGNYGQVYVLDWGLSKASRSLNRNMPSDEVAERGSNVVSAKLKSLESRNQVQICGTPSYMPPEQARGGHLDMRTDVFSLGGILCEILSGSPPYKEKCSLKCLLTAAQADIGPAYELLDRCDCDPMLVRLAKRCLSPNPEMRPSDASKVVQYIDQYIDAALRIAESDLARFFELSLDMFCIASFDGYFLRVNSNFSRSLGYSISELVSRRFIEFVHDDDHEITVKAMQGLIRGKPVIRFRNRYRSCTGDYVCLEWTAKSIVEENIVFAVAREIPSDDLGD